MDRGTKLSNKQLKDLKDLISDQKKYSKKEIMRAQTILLLDQATNVETISMLTGYKRRHIFYLRAEYLLNGLGSIIDKRKPPPKELLTRQEREEIREILLQTTPLDYGYKNEHWTTAILASLIKSFYGVSYASKTSYYVLFKQASFSYHKPGRVYEKHNEEEVIKWRKKASKQLSESWGNEEVVILTADEMVLSTQTTFQKIWLPQGDYPKIEVSNTKENRSFYGFLNLKTGQEHVFKTMKQNMYETVKCLKKIRRKYPDKKILLFWDSAGWHRGSEVQTFLKNDGNITVEYFPPYSPEENPQEHVWKTGRFNITNNKFIENIDKASNDFARYLNKTKFKYEMLGFSAI